MVTHPYQKLKALLFFLATVPVTAGATALLAGSVSTLPMALARRLTGGEESPFMGWEGSPFGANIAPYLFPLAGSAIIAACVTAWALYRTRNDIGLAGSIVTLFAMLVLFTATGALAGERYTCAVSSAHGCRVVRFFQSSSAVLYAALLLGLAMGAAVLALCAFLFRFGDEAQRATLPK